MICPIYCNNMQNRAINQNVSIFEKIQALSISDDRVDIHLQQQDKASVTTFSQHTHVMACMVVTMQAGLLLAECSQPQN